MKYHLNTFMDESEATKYPNSVSVLYCVNGAFDYWVYSQKHNPIKVTQETH